MLISPEYCALNRELHQRNPRYGTSGSAWAEAVMVFADDIHARTILDYGCGKGTLKPLLRGYQVMEFDPAIEGKNDPPELADLVVCGDVLEHIEPTCLESVLDDIRRVSRRGVFLVVGTMPAIKTLADGRNAHLIVQPPAWWLPRLMERWELVDFHDFGPAFQCTMRA